jgi:hypothetical protein
MYFTGATAMGMCGTLDAPCAYITVLRDPIERLFSEYAYLCLEGNEGHLSWTPEEIAADTGEGCPLNPVEWYESGRSTAAQLTGLLAPRGGHTQCGAEAAKANLASACVRYIFQDNLDAGMERIRAKLPDFKHLNDDGGNHKFANQAVVEGHNGSASKLNDATAARLARYRADANILTALHALVAHDMDVYAYAKQNYDTFWNRPLSTC